MKKEPATVRFQNRVNPNSTFDMVRLEDLFHKEHPDGPPDQLHKVGFFLILLVQEGRGCHTIDFTDYEFGPGTLLTIRQDQVHKFFRNDRARGYMLLFTDDFLVSYLEQLQVQQSMQLFNELLGVPKIQLSQKELMEISGIVQRMEKEYLVTHDEYSPGVIRSELHILITKLYRIKAGKNQVISRRKYLPEFIVFQALVEGNAFKTTRVQDYARMMAISTKTLNAISRSIVHKSAKQFIDEICVKQIKRLLINTSLSVKEVAYTSGFEETTNFYKYFKRQVGRTPEQFRRQF